MEPRSPMMAVARAHLVVGAFIVAAGVIGGVGLQLELWETGARWSADHYNSMIGVHGLLALAVAAPALAGCCGYVMLNAWSASRRAFVPVLAWGAFAAFAIGVCAAAAAHASPNTGWTLYSPIRQPVVDDPAVVAAIALAVAGVLHMVQLGIMLVRAARETTIARLAPIGGFVAGVAIASVLAAVAAFKPRVIDDAFIAHATTFAAVSLAVAALVQRPRSAVPPVCFGVVPALVLQRLADRFVSADDVYLHDTHFVVGQQHSHALVVAFAILAVLHAFSDSLTSRVPRLWLVWLGTIATSTGMLVHTYASMRNGAEGMPRRYWDYIPEFVANHQLATKGAVAAVAGIVLLVLAWLTSRERSTA